MPPYFSEERTTVFDTDVQKMRMTGALIMQSPVIRILCGMYNTDVCHAVCQRTTFTVLTLPSA